MEAMDIQAVESKLSDVTVTAIPMSGKAIHKELGHSGNSHATISTVPAASPSSIGKDKDNGTSKYAQLLAVIEEMGQMAVTWTSKWRWHTGYSADSVEWCPVTPHTDLLVCGTYQLDKKDEELIGAKQKRMGRIYLFQINQDTSDITAVQTIDTSGILDQKWCYHPIQDFPVLGTVTSDGYIQLYRLVDENEKVHLKLWIENSIGVNILALSLDWSTNKNYSDEPSLVVSDSTGGVTLWRIVGDSLQKIGDWKAHEFEAWISAFNYWNPDVFYSGGDDCVFKGFDRRSPDVVTANRSHEAGVTAIRCHVDVEHQLLTGSYDEKVRLWDTRSLKRCITETDVNGGVWRLKWHPQITSTILAACMYGGFRVLKHYGEISVVCEYLEHESIAYGADWKFCDDRLSVVATCSFYDCKMHVSEVDLGEE